MAVEGHVLEFVLLLKAILVGEGGHQLTLSAQAEIVDLDLLGEVDAVLRDHLVHRFLGAPVDGELLVALIFVNLSPEFVIECSKLILFIILPPNLPVENHRKFCNVLVVGLPLFECTVVGVLNGIQTEHICHTEIQIEGRDGFIPGMFFNGPILHFR